jgi:hypothetical protein
MKTEFFADSGIYRASINEGTLFVYNGAPKLHITKMTPEGVTTQVVGENNARPSELALLCARKGAPVFIATWAGNRQWNVDIDCGAQRFNGVKPHGQLIKALENCHFDNEQIKEIVTLCKKAGVQKYCPRHW